jgi:transposase-like protein
MARGYSPEFRRRVLDLIASGRKVADVARDLDVSGQTIYNWRRQDCIDRGERPGPSKRGARRAPGGAPADPRARDGARRDQTGERALKEGGAPKGPLRSDREDG